MCKPYFIGVQICIISDYPSQYLNAKLFVNRKASPHQSIMRKQNGNGASVVAGKLMSLKG
jgi:hypothetical protein